jgi:hypothetical protein
MPNEYQAVVLRQGTERATEPTLAGDGIVAQIVASAAAETRRRADLRQSVWCPARRIRRPLQAGGIRRGGNQSPAKLGLEADNTSRLPSCDGGASGGGWCRHHGDPKLARSRQLRHHKPLRSGESGDKAPGPGTPRKPVTTGQTTIMEARPERSCLARYPLAVSGIMWRR